MTDQNMTQDSSRETKELRFSEMHEICSIGDADKLEEILKSGKYEHLNYKDPDWGERTPLHWCCMKGKGDIIRRLIDKGAHPGLRSTCGWTPAHFAAESGKTNILRTLHNLNSPMDRRDLFGDTPKRIAQIYGHKEAFDFLQTAEIEYRDKRTNTELKGEAEPYDDEDMEWCKRNNFIPDSFISLDDLSTDVTGTFSIQSIGESVTSSKRSRKPRHYGKTSSKSSDDKSSIKSTKTQRRTQGTKIVETKKTKGTTSQKKKNLAKKSQKSKSSLDRISESKSTSSK